MAVSSCVAADMRTVDVYILAGQSNAVGYNDVREFKGDARRFAERIDNASTTMVWNGSDAAPGRPAGWAALRVPGAEAGEGMPAAPRSFGPEVGFAAALHERRPERRIAIIKYARGGTGIARSADYGDIIPELGGFNDAGIHWNPGTDGKKPGMLYTGLIDTVRAATQALVERKIRHVLAGLLWVQGEHEGGISPTMAADYGRLLGEFVAAVRKDLRRDELPAFIVEINEHSWRFAAAARRGQAAFCEADGHADMVGSAGLSRSGSGGPAHFDAGGMFDLGERLATAVSEEHAAER
jgi:hypothetical protein